MDIFEKIIFHNTPWALVQFRGGAGIVRHHCYMSIDLKTGSDAARGYCWRCKVPFSEEINFLIKIYNL